MGKVAVLILLALGAQVQAEDKLADILSERASKIVGYDVGDDLEDVMLGKGKKAAAAPAKAPSTGKPGVRLTDKNGKKVFGGTNKLLAGKGMPVQDTTRGIPSYWGGNRGNPNPKKVQVKLTDQSGKKVFGGTNKLLAGAGMPVQDTIRGIPDFWGGRPDLKKKGTRALPQSSPVMPLRPMAPQGARPFISGRPFAGARPFLLADLFTGTALTNIAFFVAAISMISFAVLLSRRGSSSSDQEPYFSAP